jgi:hypothetical protein
MPIHPITAVFISVFIVAAPIAFSEITSRLNRIIGQLENVNKTLAAIRDAVEK